MCVGVGTSQEAGARVHPARPAARRTARLCVRKAARTAGAGARGRRALRLTDADQPRPAISCVQALAARGRRGQAVAGMACGCTAGAAAWASAGGLCGVSNVRVGLSWAA